MKCIGCGAEAAEHPIVGVGKMIAEPKWWNPLQREPEAMQSYPVCRECWLDPAHRQRPLKLHFFSLAERERATEAARRLDEKSKRGEDLTL